MITNKELRNFKKLEKANIPGGKTPLYDEYNRLKISLSNAKNNLRFAKSNQDASKKALDKIDPEKHSVDIKSLPDGPWKDYCIFWAEKKKEIKLLNKKLTRDCKGVRNFTKESWVRALSKDMSGAKEGLNRAKDRMKQYSGHLNKISSIYDELEPKRRIAEYSDPTYIKLQEGLLQDNATFSEVYNYYSLCEKRLEQYEYKYRVAMTSSTQ